MVNIELGPVAYALTYLKTSLSHELAASNHACEALATAESSKCSLENTQPKSSVDNLRFQNSKFAIWFVFQT